MNETNLKLTPDDPKLTAYALGELAGEERAVVEAALQQNPSLTAVVDEIRAMAAQLEAALATEPAPQVDPLSRPVPAAAPEPKKRAQLLRFPQAYFVIGGLAAACFAVLLAVRTPPLAPQAPAKHQYVEVPLTPIAEEKPATEASAVASASVVVPTAPATPPTGLLVQAKAAYSRQQTEPTALIELANRDIALSRESAGNSKSWGGIYALHYLEPTPAARACDGLTKTWYYPADEGMVITALPQSRGAIYSFGLTPVAATPLQVEAFATTPTDLLAQACAADAHRQAQQVTDVIEAKREIARWREGSNSGSAGTSMVSFLHPFPLDAPFGGKPDKAHLASMGEVLRGNYYGTQAKPVFSSTLAGTRLTKRIVAEAAGAAGGPRDIGYLGVSPAPSAEAYAYRAESDFLAAKDNPLSTFSADVDTASYANVRRFIEQGRRPPADAVRIEELLNYFPFAYAAPTAADTPFAATLEVAPAPWAPTHQLVRIGLKGREVATTERGAANLVFLLDVSGSMNQPNKLPLVKESMRLLLSRLRPDDRVAIVTYAGASGLALPSTPVAQTREIVAALDELRASGSTNGAMGLQLAYDIAKANFIAGGINRVVLCTDGDFNVGPSSEGELVRLITEKAKSKVFLTALGFGMGNYKDATLQQIADAGNGHYGYIDSRREAEKLLVEQVSGTLVTIAKDVKLQVEFNPARVARYRLIGYEKRLLRAADFANDRVDAGEIGAGHTVTALYEIVPVGAADDRSAEPAAAAEALRYAGAAPTVGAPRPELAGELLTLKVRFKEPNGDTSRRLEFPLADRSASFAAASPDFKFAVAVAGFGMVLRESPHRGTATFDEVVKWAEAGLGSDPGGYRSEFIGLVKKARALE